MNIIIELPWSLSRAYCLFLSPRRRPMKRRRKNKIRNLIKFANFYELTRVTSIINPVSGWIRGSSKNRVHRKDQDQGPSNHEKHETCRGENQNLRNKISSASLIAIFTPPAKRERMKRGGRRKDQPRCVFVNSIN